MKSPFLLLGFLGLSLIHLLILKQITFTAWPEMFSYPYLMNNGFLIYKDIAHPYVPLLSFILALYYKITGLNLLTHQIFTWGLILINDLLIFLIANKLLKKNLILIPLAIYVFLQPIFEGNMLWFDLVATPFILGSFLIFISIKNSARKLFWFGFLLSLALLVKQQSIVLVGLVFLVLLLSKETRKSIGHFILGGVIPVSAIFAILSVSGAFKDYIFWTLEFPLIWLPKFPGYSDMPVKKDILLLILMFGLPVIFLVKNFFKITIFQKIILISIIAAVIMAFPRFSLFHLQPAIAVLIIFYITVLNQSKKAAIVFLTIGLFYGLLLWKDYRPFIGVETARFYDNEEIELAGFIKQNTTAEDSIYFLGPHSMLYILSGRLPPKPWIENFVWHFEIPGMQEKQIEGFEKERNLVIFKQGAISGNWFDLGTYQPKEIENYIYRNFEMVNKNKEGIEVWKRKN